MGFHFKNTIFLGSKHLEDLQTMGLGTGSITELSNEATALMNGYENQESTDANNFNETRKCKLVEISMFPSLLR